MRSKPSINVESTKIDTVVDVLGWIGMLSQWVLFFLYSYNFHTLSGLNNWNKVLTVSISSSVIFLLLSIISQFPHRLHYPVKINYDNMSKQYHLALFVIGLYKILVLLSLGLFTILLVIQEKGFPIRYKAMVLLLVAILLSFFFLWFFYRNSKKMN